MDSEGGMRPAVRGMQVRATGPDKAQAQLSLMHTWQDLGSERFSHGTETINITYLRAHQASASFVIWREALFMKMPAGTKNMHIMINAYLRPSATP